MFTFDFAAKLKRLNPDLYLVVDRQSSVGASGNKVTGIYRRWARGEKVAGLEHLDDSTRHYMEDVESGEMHEFICGVPTQQIPEFDEFEFDKERPRNNKLVARGWRSVLRILIEKRLVNVNKARQVFGASSLMDCEYDRLGFERKVEWAKGLRHARF